jgi:hypothetical protein
MREIERSTDESVVVMVPFFLIWWTANYASKVLSDKTAMHQGLAIYSRGGTAGMDDDGRLGDQG